MFKSDTVLVVGAGASCEAGLPSGDKLKEHIARLLNFKFDNFGAGPLQGDSRIYHALKTISGREPWPAPLPDCRLSEAG